MICRESHHSSRNSSSELLQICKTIFEGLHIAQCIVDLLTLLLERQPSVSVELGENVATFTIELQNEVVVLPQGGSVTNSEQCDVQCFCMPVDNLLDVQINSRGAFIKNGKL